ncbi:pyrimidine-specific ribonucleoside hydrolase [Leucobacter luti]|uniref:Pyrimidine-specific ribonucleoside hydrolase n=1 Tax=Leucobacter luti TaxID=340320 RepID=A0A4R6RYR7_9MICO|nr:nucleoside hydrolase [Leucobacter luti]TDP91406.1 pyrimidine-specific ribonucleoside hydrolase [Leucobacter luti]
MPRPIIIDTDPGIDDALAIMLAAASPEVELLGIVAVAGNVGIEYTAPNAAALADLLGLDCPVGRGSSSPLWRTPEYAPQVHGENGFGGYSLPASERVLEPGVPLLARLIESSADPVTVVAIGPLTNIALLMAEYPETAQKVERFVIMGGGTLRDTGNATPTAEFNIAFDPEAAVRVFGFGVPITMVGLNATHQALVGAQHLPDLMASGGPAAQMVAHLLGSYSDDANADSGDTGMAQHDSLALAAVLDPAVIGTEHYRVDVENTGRLTTGMTVVDYLGRWGTPNCDVAFDVDVPRFRALLNTRLTALDSRLKEARS